MNQRRFLLLSSVVLLSLLITITTFGIVIGSESPAASPASHVTPWAFVGSVIAAVVALVGNILVFVASTIANNSKRREIENIANSKINELAQIQLRDILNKRIEVYPQLWCIAQTMLSDWEREKKETNTLWARNLFNGLIAWHKKNGVFLSQDAYEMFHALRLEAQDVVRSCDQGHPPTVLDLKVLDRIYSGGPQNVDSVNTSDRRGLSIWWESCNKSFDETHTQVGVGLATELKNDLGSYQRSAIAV
jgi:hypothetical protein